ncbi:MAG: YdcF family protein [Pseudomonadales bacterium]|jgi:uncharacterized SAM-binding protein YcdF (DUF218 family)
MHDAIIVLGYSTDEDDPVFQSRVKKSVELYNRGLAGQIIMSGCCSFKLDIRPNVTEAVCMRDYAIDLGLPPEVIMLEEESVDTLGNLYFSKKNILLACSWYNIGIISTRWHIYRTTWLAEMVLGPDFDVTGYESGHPQDWTEKDVNRSETYNKSLLEETREQLRDVEPGDHEAIAPFLAKAPKV